MMQRLPRAVLRKLPHEHDWEIKRLGGGLRHQECTRCGEVALTHVPRGGAKDHEERAKRLWGIEDEPTGEQA